MSKYDLQLFELKMKQDSALSKVIKLEADLKDELERVRTLKEDIERNVSDIDELQKAKIGNERLKERIAAMKSENGSLRKALEFGQ